jgi:6-phosphogluconolactonase (cycloisomerase 2 family)
MGSNVESIAVDPAGSLAFVINYNSSDVSVYTVDCDPLSCAMSAAADKWLDVAGSATIAVRCGIAE